MLSLAFNSCGFPNEPGTVNYTPSVPLLTRVVGDSVQVTIHFAYPTDPSHFHYAPYRIQGSGVIITHLGISQKVQFSAGLASEAETQKTNPLGVIVGRFFGLDSTDQIAGFIIIDNQEFDGPSTSSIPPAINYGNWKRIADMSLPLKNTRFVAGGKAFFEVLDNQVYKIYEYSPITKSWKFASQWIAVDSTGILRNTSGFQVIEANNMCYAKSLDGTLFLQFDPATDNTTILQKGYPTTVERNRPAIFFADGASIYYGGGSGGGNQYGFYYYTDFERYSIANNSWQASRILPFTSGGFDVAYNTSAFKSGKGYHYTQSYYSQSDTLWSYDPAKDEWTNSTVARNDGTFFGNDGKALYAVTNSDAGSFRKGSIWSFDPTARTWTKVIDLPTNFGTPILATDGKDFYLTNGLDGAFFQYTR
jgi:hypothetical protein